ncbi:unnamed protein product [Cuscuta europaea]|nr:unnamed protein product [Cuscuta europaea]
MAKTAREEQISIDIEAQSIKIQKKDLQSGVGKTLCVLTFHELYVVNINTNCFGIGGISNNDICTAIDLPNLIMGMVAIKSKILLVGGQELIKDGIGKRFRTDRKYNQFFSSKVYELKQDTKSMTVAASEVIPNLNEGKGMPIVQKFGSKIFVLHSMGHFKPNVRNSCTEKCIFEVYDFSSPTEGWVAKLYTPIHDIVESSGCYTVNMYCRVGDKLYLNVDSSRAVKSFILDLKTEKWSEDDCFFAKWTFRALLEVGVSVPGLDHGQHVILGCKGNEWSEFPQFYASLFTEGKGFSCYQRIDDIFSLGEEELGFASCGFLELGNGEFFGIMICLNIKVKDFYLVVSTFCLDVITTPALSFPLSVKYPSETNFLRVNLRNQQMFKLEMPHREYPFICGAAVL